VTDHWYITTLENAIDRAPPAQQRRRSKKSQPVSML
jgi:hypothetical protein